MVTMNVPVYYREENGTRIGSDFADVVCAFDVYAVCDIV